MHRPRVVGSRQFQQRRHEILRLHEAVHLLAGRGHPRDVRDQRQVIHRRMQRERVRRRLFHHDRLADQPVLAKVVAVVGHEHDRRVVPEIQAVHGIQDFPEPAIHQRDLAAVQRVAMTQLLRREEVLPVVVLRERYRLARVVRVVLVGVPVRRVPRLVGVEGVHHQAKRPVGVIALQPFRRRPEGPRAEVVGLLHPVRRIPPMRLE